VEFPYQSTNRFHFHKMASHRCGSARESRELGGGIESDTALFSDDGAARKMRASDMRESVGQIERPEDERMDDHEDAPGGSKLGVPG
jgi:hypothetical protein